MQAINLVVIVSSLLCFSVEVQTQSDVVADSTDEVESVCKDYVTYYRGSSLGWPPVILSAPHGGSLRPTVIPDRDAGCWIDNEKRCEYSHTCGSKDFTR